MAYSGRSSAILFLMGVCTLTASQGFGASPMICPRPKTAEWSGENVILAEPGEAVGFHYLTSKSVTLREGGKSLGGRIRALGFTIAPDDAGSSAGITLVESPSDEFVSRLREQGVAEELDPRRLRQAYTLVIEKSADGEGTARLEAASPLGLYYSQMSLCQLLDKDEEGRLTAPAGKVVDYPEIGIRLGKTSASMSSPEDLEGFAAWMAANRMSHLGLQYHGHNSRDPEPPFRENVERSCGEYREKGTMETVVYFCPFRRSPKDASGAYDFTKEEDREEYAGFLRWILEQGADGIEVDYNDWPGSGEVPIADVLNLAYRTITAVRPDAVILYCPPNRGEESYRGMATPQLTKTLSQVPAKVWPLWTGMQTLIKEPLTKETVLEWTKKAGRRPFLWVNRVGPAVPEPFVQIVEGEGGGPVFAGELLPKDLNGLFDGVHLNAGLQKGYNLVEGTFSDESLVYLATTADYLWNPKGWKAEESLERGRRFMELMRPLMSSNAEP